MISQRKYPGYITTGSKNVYASSGWEGNNPSKAKTKLTVHINEAVQLTIDGRRAREIFNVLKKHYEAKDAQ